MLVNRSFILAAAAFGVAASALGQTSPKHTFTDTLTEKAEVFSTPQTGIVNGAALQYSSDGRLRRLTGQTWLGDYDSPRQEANAFVQSFGPAMGLTNPN